MNEVSPSKATEEKEVEIDYLELDKIIEEEFGNDKENLIMILQAIQRRYNFLPQATLKYLAEKIDIPYSQIYGVGTFYATFSLEPKGRNIISICLGTACHVRGGERVRERIEDTLNLNGKKTTEDMRFTLEGVRCIGCCSLGPVMKVNEDVHGRIGADEVKKVLEKYE
ncbi:MAG: NAD(P)H-dependent oxidoreductase subunit E [Desulfobacteraceae bacterium]|nr:NAD(P)H-dependent oxidoreductase subunit E [Desulfobacteraceae bacterium]MDH3573207.1 NAD(P)H-dependent oxidoreductase subunit E [Desulfobacteraceae bacterium]MDH3720732.1 NAD(P)H-dependent oxidoreductase subunit E [Desulfobacteraceae bacterium]MDH3836280.1 NAD(P)H-dependent oxidoreductase subunit E [Desulfobacteraceae bacterium]MDH3873944.1 NAD(P)H-dependent oxidoreductase subunit E [Desulfobacteraceae bacterium]